LPRCSYHAQELEMPVEVSVQDCFYGNWSSELGEALVTTPSSSAPIAPETWEIWFQRWLDRLQPVNDAAQPLHPQSAYELSLRLTNNSEMQTLNHQYRHKDQPTDVLAFAALEVDCPTGLPSGLVDLPLYLGDIVISVETATQQARQQGHNLTTELAWLAAHGLLHLLGWDHPDDKSLLQMLNQQQLLLETVGLAVLGQ
jgi:probable rRNA maturation factor